MVEARRPLQIGRPVLAKGKKGKKKGASDLELEAQFERDLALALEASK